MIIAEISIQYSRFNCSMSLTAAGKLRKTTLTEAAAVSYWDTCRADDQTKSLPKAKVKNSKSKKVKTRKGGLKNGPALHHQRTDAGRLCLRQTTGCRLEAVAIRRHSNQGAVRAAGSWRADLPFEVGTRRSAAFPSASRT